MVTLVVIGMMNLGTMALVAAAIDGNGVDAGADAEASDIGGNEHLLAHGEIEAEVEGGRVKDAAENPARMLLEI